MAPRPKQLPARLLDEVAAAVVDLVSEGGGSVSADEVRDVLDNTVEPRVSRIGYICTACDTWLEYVRGGWECPKDGSSNDGAAIVVAFYPRGVPTGDFV